MIMQTDFRMLSNLSLMIFKLEFFIIKLHNTKLTKIYICRISFSLSRSYTSADRLGHNPKTPNF